MCFSPEASLIAFSIGVVSWVALLQQRMYSAAFIVFYLFIMQLLEYFAHTSIIERDATMNVITSKLIFFFVSLQPLLFYGATYIAKEKYFFRNTEKFLFLMPIYVVFILFFYAYLNSRSLFKTTYLDNSCTSICRISWDFFGYNKVYTLIALFFYFAICIAFYKVGVLPYYAIILLVVSVIYTMFLSRDLKKMLSLFGSIWCFLAVTYGPLELIKKFNPSFWKV